MKKLNDILLDWKKRRFNNKFKDIPDFVREKFEDKIECSTLKITFLMNVAQYGLKREMFSNENFDEDLDFAVNIYERIEGVKFLYMLSQNRYHMFNIIYGEKVQELFDQGQFSFGELEVSCEKMVENLVKTACILVRKGVSAERYGVEEFLSYGLKHDLICYLNKQAIVRSFHHGETLEDLKSDSSYDDLPQQIAQGLLNWKIPNNNFS